MAQQTKNNKNNTDNVLSFFQDDSVEPFDVDYQNRFLNVFISDKDGFSERIIDVVDVNYFDSYQKIILDYSLNFFNKYREIARFSTLQDIISEKEKGLNKEQLLGLLEKIKNTNIENANHIKDSSYRYFKERSVKNCLFELVAEWKKHNYDSMKVKLENALKAGEPKETGHKYLNDVSKRLSKNFRDPIPFIVSLDALIGGGLSAGEMGVILAPTGGGKSMFLVAGAATALMHGKKVLYYTLELSEEVVGQRFDACINQIALSHVFDFPDVIEEKMEELANLGGSLIIKKFPSGQATINTLMAHVRTLETSEGFRPDIIFIDYGDLLKPTESYSEKRHSLDSIYVGIRGMADELRIPIWNAAQTNRDGMDTDEISLRSIGESLGNARTADVVISVGRDPDEVAINPHAAKIGILKNRNGQAGIYRDAIFDSSKIFIEVLPPDPQKMGIKKVNSTNKKSKKKEDTVDDVESQLDNNFNSIPLG